MSEFLSKTLTPEIFWTALAAIGTLVAVLVALFTSTISIWRNNRRIARLIEAELLGNMQIIRNMCSRESRKLPDGIEVSAAQNNDALREHIDLRLWHEFRYQLAASNPSKYQLYQDINRYAEAVVDATMEPPAIRMMLQAALSKTTRRYLAALTHNRHKHADQFSAALQIARCCGR